MQMSLQNPVSHVDESYGCCAGCNGCGGGWSTPLLPRCVAGGAEEPRTAGEGTRRAARLRGRARRGARGAGRAAAAHEALDVLCASRCFERHVAVVRVSPRVASAGGAARVQRTTRGRAAAPASGPRRPRVPVASCSRVARRVRLPVPDGRAVECDAAVFQLSRLFFVCSPRRCAPRRTKRAASWRSSTRSWTAPTRRM